MAGAVLRVTVVGGGIGGMAAALLLSHVGARVTLCERAAGPSAAGGAIALYPNGLAVLSCTGSGCASGSPRRPLPPERGG